MWRQRHVNTEEDTASQQSSSLKEDTASGYHHCRLQAAKVWKTTHCHFITAYIIFHAHNTFEYKPQTYRKQFCIVCCLQYFNLVSQRTYFLANFLSDYMRCEVAQIPAPFTPTQCISVFTRKCYICRSVYMRFEIAQIQSTFKTNILISLCDNCQEAISLETTQAMSPYHPRKVHHRSLFQRKQLYETHSRLALRPNLQQKPVPTKAGLLNALDGPTANIGNMLFMTTNNYDAFDKALIKHCVNALSHNWTDTPSQDTAQSHAQGRRKTKNVRVHATCAKVKRLVRRFYEYVFIRKLQEGAIQASNWTESKGRQSWLRDTDSSSMAVCLQLQSPTADVG